MTESVYTLDELLNDPMVKLVMERDRVHPEEFRLLLIERTRRSEEPSLLPHVIARAKSRISMCRV